MSTNTILSIFKLLKKGIDFLLYSNVWIAGCAVAMVCQTELLLAGKAYYTPVVGLVFWATLFLYAIHRIVGLSKAKDFFHKERYTIIADFQTHILVYAVIGGLGGGYIFLFQLDRQLQLALLLPAFFSLGYVLPVFGNQRRLRDFSFLKIFLIALVWAWITVGLPVLEGNYLQFDSTTDWWMFGLLFAERCFFIFAITLPFDIRDMDVDAQNQVKTIPTQIGVKATKRLAVGVLSLAVGCMLGLTYFGLPTYLLITWIFAYVVVGGLVFRVSPDLHDYYYTALIDGTMIFIFLVLCGSSYFFG